MIYYNCFFLKTIYSESINGLCDPRVDRTVEIIPYNLRLGEWWCQGSIAFLGDDILVPDCLCHCLSSHRNLQLLLQLGPSKKHM